MWKKDNFNPDLIGLHLWRRYDMLLLNKIQATLAIFSFILFLTSCGARKKIGSYENPKAKPGTVSKSRTASKAGLTAYYAELLGVKPDDLNRDLYAFIDSWMGSPHRLGGMSKSGIDCSGFVNLAFRE